MKTVILFDFIGTLADASKRYIYAFDRVCEKYGITPPSHEELAKRLGEKNLKQIVAEFAPNITETQLDTFMYDCNVYCDGLLKNSEWVEELYPGAEELIKTLNASGATLGIYTGIRETALKNLIDYHLLDDLFDKKFIRAKDNIRDGFVPSAQLKQQQLESITQEIFKRFGQETNVIVVGDSLADFEAAKAVNCEFIGFAPSTDKKKMFESEGTISAESFSKLREMLLPKLSSGQINRLHQQPSNA